MPTKHITVLKNEAIEELKIKPEGVYVDATLGGGGHSLEILKNLQKGTLISLDQDQEAIQRFEQVLEKINTGDNQVILKQTNFENLIEILKQEQIEAVDGIIADLGLSTDQLEDDERGFTFQKNAELDMRMDKTLQVKAKDLVNGLYKKELVKLFEDLADVNFANRLANMIIEERKQQPINTTKQLKTLVQKIVPYSKRVGTNKHPEAKVFQALRIAVNDELNSLRSFLPPALETLSTGGRLAVISFHSGEDRIIKNFYKQAETEGKAIVIGDYLTPTAEEIAQNPSSRSAKLRVLQKI